MNLSEGASSFLLYFFIPLLGETFPEEAASIRIFRACLLSSLLLSCYCCLRDFSGDWGSEIIDGSFLVLLLVWRMLLK